MSSDSCIVISQSMLFPWVGLLEQIRSADIFVHYDDVQFSKGSLVNRVQLKLPEGIRWLTIPIDKNRSGQRINELQPHNKFEWLSRHLDLLKRSFADAPFKDEAIGLAESVYVRDYDNIGDLSRASMMSLVEYFGLNAHTNFIDVRDLDIHGSSTDRVLNVVKHLGGKIYVTGHGASQYLNHDKFEEADIVVRYMNYECIPYKQNHGPFTPFVSALDLIANCGKDGIEVMVSETKVWREFLV
jgi:hypothetical protein